MDIISQFEELICTLKKNDAKQVIWSSINKGVKIDNPNLPDELIEFYFPNQWLATGLDRKKQSFIRGKNC